MPANDYAARPRRGDAVATIRTARLLMNSETVPPTAADPFANQPHAIVERDGVRYTLLGTAHVSKDSVSARSEEHTSELQSLMRISYAVFCLKKKTKSSFYSPH